MPPEITEHRSESSSVDAPAIAKAGAAVDPDGKLPPTDSASKAVPPASQGFTRRRKFLTGVLCAVVIAAAVYGIPWIRFVLSTVSTDDAYVNGHVTFVAPASAARFPAFWWMTTTVCTKGIFSLNWTRSHFETQSR
jgi:membrane fusion protein, multidrug efflux system